MGHTLILWFGRKLFLSHPEEGRQAFCVTSIDPWPVRRTEDLRRGRTSSPSARYFVTCCAIRPCRTLTEPPLAAVILDFLQSLSTAGDIALLAATVMPDHLHVLLTLGGRLRLSRVIGKFKTQTRPAMLAHDAAWQANFFEHRLRPDEDAEPYARYVFMNPYRAGLLPRTEPWPWWRAEADFEFLRLLPEGHPPAAWMTAPWEQVGIDDTVVGEPVV